MNLMLMFTLGMFIITTCVTKCNGQSYGMVALTKTDNEEPDILSRKELNSIYGVAKNISHSRGSVIKSKEGEFEYRRSFTKKVELRVHSLQLQEILTAIKNNSTQTEFSTSGFLDSLNLLESLVHQYDIGKQFVDVGGFNLIVSLTAVENVHIANAAFTVLSAALQGNKDVQKYSLTTDLLKCIISTLHEPLPTRTNSALYTLSAFIRNCPESLSLFLIEKGISTLSFVLTNHFSIRKIHLKVIDIFGDITIDLYGENFDEDSPILLPLQKVFSADILLYSICDQIVDVFYISDEYTAHEKIVTVLNVMFDICKDIFYKKQLIFDVENLIEYYNPFKRVKEWYAPMVDLELKYYIFQDLKKLKRKMLSYVNETSIMKSEIKNLKTEL